MRCASTVATGRCGHLFPNRYKSILGLEDAYLLEQVRYIHLNRNSERVPRSLLRGTRAKIQIRLNILTVEDSLQRAAGNLQSAESEARRVDGGALSL
jgi:hypothetical protein